MSMRKSAIMVILLIAISLYLPAALPVRADGITISNGIITISVDSNGNPYIMTTSRVPYSPFEEPATQYLFYDGSWHAFTAPTTVAKTSATTYTAIYNFGGFDIQKDAKLMNYPAIVFTYTIKSYRDVPVKVGFHFSVDYHPGDYIAQQGGVEPMWIQLSNIKLPYGTPIPIRYNGSNVVVMQLKMNQFCFMAVDSRVPVKAVLASHWSYAHDDPSSWGGTSSLGNDQAIGVEALDMTIPALGTVTFRASIGQDIVLQLAQIWGYISTA